MVFLVNLKVFGVIVVVLGGVWVIFKGFGIF